jgi:hypothetical protein
MKVKMPVYPTHPVYRVPELRANMITESDLYYLRSILGNLREVRAVVEFASLGGEALADNVDWLDCFIDKHERANNMDPMFQFFNYEHLREDLKPISKQFADVAQWVIDNLPRNPERTVALRKLLEAKDCAVRAALYKES